MSLHPSQLNLSGGRLVSALVVSKNWICFENIGSGYEDATFITLASYHEDADLTITTAPGGSIAGENLPIWSEGRIPWRSGDREYNGVFLGWNRAKDAPVATYALALPAGAVAIWHLTQTSTP